VQGSSVGSSRHDDLELRDEDLELSEEEGSGRKCRAEAVKAVCESEESGLRTSSGGLKVAQPLSQASAEVQAVGETELPAERSFREPKDTQASFCYWPLACRALPLGIHTQLTCGAA